MGYTTPLIEEGNQLDRTLLIEEVNSNASRLPNLSTRMKKHLDIQSGLTRLEAELVLSREDRRTFQRGEMFLTQETSA